MSSMPASTQKGSKECQEAFLNKDRKGICSWEKHIAVKVVKSVPIKREWAVAAVKKILEESVRVRVSLQDAVGIRGMKPVIPAVMQ